MDWIQTIVLALVQGLTEFLPISSSAHLILVPELLGWPDQGLAFDVAVHVGTLGAVLAYFYRDVLAILRGWFGTLTGHWSTEGKLGWLVIAGTIPVGLAGLLGKDFIEAYLRSPIVIAWATIGFGILLGLADRVGKKIRTGDSLNWRDALLIGGSQALALIPGTSRSGITITTGLFLGLTPQAAARFSFLLSIPLIVLAGGLETKALLDSGNATLTLHAAVGALLAGVSAYLSIHFFLKLLARIGMLPFVIYRLILGGILLAVFL